MSKYFIHFRILGLMGIHPVYAESEDEARAKGIKELAFAYMVDKKLVRITKVSKEK